MSLRPEDCAGVSGIDPTVVQAIINQSLTSVSQTLIKAVDERLEEFKSTLAPSEDSARPSKRLKVEASTLKKPGNQQQFQHGVKVLEKFESALESLGHNQVDKAKEALREGIALVQHRIKLIRIADKSEFGWETVNQYEADELASDSEDLAGRRSCFKSTRHPGQVPLGVARLEALGGSVPLRVFVSCATAPRSAVLQGSS